MVSRNYHLVMVALTFLVAAEVSANDEEEYNFNQFLTLDLRTKQLRDLCPAGIDRCHCLNKIGNYTTGPFYYDEDPVGSVVTHVGCSPDFCYCKDSPDVRRDSRPKELSAVMDLCPVGEMNRCLCHDNAVVHFPFDMATFFFTCRPKRCKCKNDKKVKKVTGLGCAKGGFPYCDADDFDMQYFCKNGQRGWLNFLLQYQIEGREGCFCGDGSVPKCKNNRERAQCPDGSFPDPKVYTANFLADCEEDDGWKFGQAHQKWL